MTERAVFPIRRHRPNAGRYGARAFTLLEALISLALMIMLMAGVYEYYLTIIRERQAAIASLHETLLMRGILEQMAEEIHQATDVRPGEGDAFGGTEEMLTIVRMKLPDGSAYDTYDNKWQGEPSAGRQDLQRITYYLERDREVQDDDGTDVCRGLVREQSKIINPKPGAFTIAQKNPNESDQFDLGIEGMGPQTDRELSAPEVKYIRFEYLDGAIWHKTWKPIDQTGTAGSTDASTGDETTGLDGTAGGTGTTGTSGLNAGGTAGTGLGSAAGAGGLGSAASAMGTGGAASALGTGSAAGATGSSSKASTGRVALPQAIRITIGTVKGPWRDDFDLGQIKTEEEEDDKIWHPDRWSIEVYLRQADPTTLSSRQYGHGLGDEEDETVKQTQGGGQ